MGSPRYSAINTKLRGMEARFLNQNDYNKLLQCTSVEEVASYLKSTKAYSDILAKIDTSSINRGALEYILKSSMINDVESIINYFSGNYKKFIHALYAKHEIAEMKQLARRLFNSIPTSLVYDNENPSLTFIGKYSGVDKQKVAQAEKISDIINAYEGTPLYKYIKPLLLSDNENNLFRFETVLDIAYYSILMKESEKFNSKDKKLIQSAIGIVGDLLNIQWIYRGMYFYHMLPAVLFNYSINAGYKFSKRKIRDLCYLPNIESLQNQIKKTKYSFLIKNDDTTDSYMERRLERFIYFNFLKMRWDNPMSIIQAFSHIIFLEYQIRDITTLIEVIKYHLPPEEAQRYLIKYIAERS